MSWLILSYFGVQFVPFYLKLDKLIIQGIQQQALFQATQALYPPFDAVFANMEGATGRVQAHPVIARFQDLTDPAHWGFQAFQWRVLIPIVDAKTVV